MIDENRAESDVYFFIDVINGTHKTVLWYDFSLPQLRTRYIRTPKAINFPFGTNETLMVLGVPILMKIRV